MKAARHVPSRARYLYVRGRRLDPIMPQRFPKHAETDAARLTVVTPQPRNVNRKFLCGNRKRPLQGDLGGRLPA